MIDSTTFGKLIPTNKQADDWYALAQEFFPNYNINTPKRIAHFMAQAAHESNNFAVLEENLNYSTANLRKVFPRYFPTEAAAKAAAGKPEVIANIVYDDKNRTSKLGNTQAGDGWKFRGGGIFQLTGRDNYANFGKSVGMTADQAVDYVRTKRGAMESACWFWSTRNLNAVSDGGSVESVTKIVNGGTNGLADRKAKYTKFLPLVEAAFKPSTAPLTQQAPQVAKEPVSAPVVAPVASTTFYTLSRRADNNKDHVKQVQTALKIGVDGIFGLGTESAIRSWQRLNGFVVSGQIDKVQFTKLTSK